MHELKNSFLKRIFSNKNKNALLYENASISYFQLAQAVLENVSMLRAMRGNIIGIVGDYDVQSIALFLACIELNKIIVPFVDEREMAAKLEELRCDLIFKGAKPILEDHNTNNHGLINQLIKENKGALILFSSGSTQKPKVIVHDLSKIISSLKFGNKEHRIIALFLPDHVAGLDILLKSLCSNSSLVIPSKRQADTILKNICLHSIDIMPIPVSMLRLICLVEHKKYDLQSVKLIAYASEKMDSTLLLRVQKIFQNAYIKQNFGTSETFSLQTKDHTTHQMYFKILNAQYKIIENQLYIKAHTQSLGYLNADNGAFTDDGYFATGDLVEFIDEEDGRYIKIVGRHKELINVGGNKVIPQEIEGLILQLPFIKDCLVYPLDNAITGQSVCLKVVLDQTMHALELKKKILDFCKARLSPYKIPSKIVVVEKIELSQRLKKSRKMGL